ncbi:MAG: VTT domain-containing protein [Verrucomicrobiales bacterium]|nr:VTT domain-containing protein [Verrucomicrobiales bacterium]
MDRFLARLAEEWNSRNEQHWVFYQTMDDELPSQGDTRRGRPRAGRARLVLVLLFLTGLYALGKWSGLYEEMTLKGVREQILAAGPRGALLLVLLFVIGLLIQVPGMVFVVAGFLVYDPVRGAALAFGGSILALTVSFFVVRRIGGQPFRQIRFKWVQRVLSHLEERPLLTVALLRLVLQLSPVVNYALALSGIRYRDYILGSLIGFTPIILTLAFLADRLEKWFT